MFIWFRFSFNWQPCSPLLLYLYQLFTWTGSETLNLKTALNIIILLLFYPNLWLAWQFCRFAFLSLWRSGSNQKWDQFTLISGDNRELRIRSHWKKRKIITHSSIRTKNGRISNSLKILKYVFLILNLIFKCLVLPQKILIFIFFFQIYFLEQNRNYGIG